VLAAEAWPNMLIAVCDAW